MDIGSKVKIVSGFNPSFSNHTPRAGEEGVLVAIVEGRCPYVVEFPSYTGKTGVVISNPRLSFYEAEVKPA